MRKSIFSLIIVLFAFVQLNAENAQIHKYELKNGLTVYLNEDHSQPTVFGAVVVKAGAKDDPEDATGLAHYMEHVMFKGTQELGTCDWEAEKPHYERIVELYEELRNTTDEAKKAELNKEINKESLAAGKYAIPNEFSNMVQAMGGTRLNAGTGYDYTYYHNSFPSFQIQRWLDLYAHRFENPVYRGFQSELETVYEEKNMYSDNYMSNVNNDFRANIFGEGNPYGRLILGETEHLKNPSIKRIVEFYNQFYVPSNMALILSGDINIDEVKPMIEQTFGKWEATPQEGVNKEPENVKISKSEKIKVKKTPFPLIQIGFPGAESGNKDEYVLEICNSILSNDSKTGLLDKLVLEGDLYVAVAGHSQHKFAGYSSIIAVPTFDMSQMKYVSLSVVEKMIDNEIEKLKNGTFDDWLINSIKDEMIREYKKLFESPENMGSVLVQLYSYETSLDEFFKYEELIRSITKEQIIEVARKYFTDDRLTYLSDIGIPDKDKLEKPEYEIIDPEPGHQSEYAKHFERIPFAEVKEHFVDFENDIEETDIADKVHLYYTENPKNDVFSMTLKFGVGIGEIETLDLATQLMNTAGVMAQFTPQELKREYSKLGCAVDFSVSESYLYIELEGNEANLGKACNLLSRTFLLPQLDEKQLQSVIGGELGSRQSEKDNVNIQQAAMQYFTIYGDNSPYMKRINNSDLQALTISDLTGAFISATNYEASIHYVGKLPFEQLIETLKGNLALPANLKDSESPYVRPLAKSEDIIYFLSNKDARQSAVFLYADGAAYNLAEEPVINAFNQYFGGGFNGLVLQELREKRSFAYNAGAYYNTPSKVGEKTFWDGSITTQSDKTIDALTEFMKLVNDMPDKPERMENIKNYLVQSAQSSRPGFRELSQTIEYWRLQGYKEDPNKQLISKYQSLEYDDIRKFYENSLSGKKITIGIVGNNKDVDQKLLKGISKVKRISSSGIFTY
ncbi:MAG: insulinase family protein [Prolixibacteraceae bacterium]|nr:insulinase family protein [Prolixibacteraceae bacterium]MBN2649913.1 insulinase family protein [Prolixibacteraceae bacterium]